MIAGNPEAGFAPGDLRTLDRQSRIAVFCKLMKEEIDVIWAIPALNRLGANLTLLASKP
jgi:hypothetical protein